MHYSSTHCLYILISALVYVAQRHLMLTFNLDIPNHAMNFQQQLLILHV